MKKLYHLTIIIINLMLFALGIVLMTLTFCEFNFPIKDGYIYLLGLMLIISSCYTITEATYNIINNE